VKFCNHATTNPPKDAGCPWCRIEKLEWDLVGEKAKFEKALGDIQQLERRLSVLVAERCSGSEKGI
jgi:hypothetical protein